MDGTICNINKTVSTDCLIQNLSKQRGPIVYSVRTIEHNSTFQTKEKAVFEKSKIYKSYTIKAILFYNKNILFFNL